MKTTTKTTETAPRNPRGKSALRAEKRLYSVVPAELSEWLTGEDRFFIESVEIDEESGNLNVSLTTEPSFDREVSAPPRRPAVVEDLAEGEPHITEVDDDAAADDVPSQIPEKIEALPPRRRRPS